MPKKYQTPTFKVGDRVYRRGGSGTVVAVNDNGSYQVEMAWGETVWAVGGELAARA